MKLFLFQVGRVRPPHPVGETIFPVPAYLIETDTGEHILIDTGLDRRLIGTSHHQPSHPHLLNEDEDLLTHLARLNLTAQDIRLVICSHFDPDHAGNLALFQQAEIVVQRRLYNAAIKGEVPRFERTRDQWDALGLRFLLVDGDITLVPGVTLCRVGTRRSALLSFSEYPPPNLACAFQRTRLSSIIGVAPSESVIPCF